jgi:hypothetical protein
MNIIISWFKESRLILFRVLIVCLVMLGIFMIFQLSNHLKVNDFIEYWSSSRIIIHGGNPYSPDDLLVVQKEGGLNVEQPTIMYNPPWLLPILIPFGYFSRPNGQVLWLLTQIAVLIFCSNSIWKLYAGKINHQWIGWIATFTFGAVIAAVLFQGQISPLILMGLVGFLAYAEKPGKEWLSGVFAVLITMKPQVVYLFILGIFQ